MLIRPAEEGGGKRDLFGLQQGMEGRGHENGNLG